MEKIAILCPGAFDYILNKTGNMLIRYQQEKVCCVIDPKKSGKVSKDVIGYGGKIPIVSNYSEAKKYSPDTLVIGSAPQGGIINENYSEEIKSAIKDGCDIYSGMHQFLNDDPTFKNLSENSGITLHDLRRPPDPPHFPKGTWQERSVPVLLIVGTDCDTGKMTTGWEITERLRTRGKDVRFVGTGQTGILLGGYGVAVDAVVADFMAGEIEFAIDQASDGADLVVVEGQGSLSNMLYSGVTLGLMHGAMPDYMIMTHELGREMDVSDYPMPAIEYVMNLHLSLMENFRNSKFLGMNVISVQFEENKALDSIRKLESKYRMPVTDLVRFGDRDLIHAIEERLV